MKYLVLVGLLSFLPVFGCKTNGYRNPNEPNMAAYNERRMESFRTNIGESIKEVYRDDYDNDGKIDCVMESTFSGDTRLDEVDVNADGKIDIRCVIRYLEDGRMHVRFDGDSDGIFEDDFYYIDEVDM